MDTWIDNPSTATASLHFRLHMLRYVIHQLAVCLPWTKHYTRSPSDLSSFCPGAHCWT